MAASSSSSQNVELEAAKFLQKLIQESKDEPAKLATKLYVILQHMKSSGKEHSMPYQVISRAMETVINQHGLDIEALKSSRASLSGPQSGESLTLRQSDSLPTAGGVVNTKLGVGEQEMPKSNLFASGKAVGSSSGHEYYQGSGSLTNRSNQSFDQESPSSVDTRSANSQSHERRDATSYGKPGSQKDGRKTEPKRKRRDPSPVSEPHMENPQKGERGNNQLSTRKGKMNKVETSGSAGRGIEQTDFNILQSAGPMDHLPSSLLTRVNQEDQMQRVASYDGHALVSMHEQRTMDTYGLSSTPLEHSMNRGIAQVSSNRGDASLLLASESSIEHDRGRVSMTDNEGRSPAVSESGVLRNLNTRDTGKALVSQASAVPGTPFKEHQLKQLRAQCLVFLAFRSGLPPKQLHLDISLGNIFPKEGTNVCGLQQEPNDQKRAVQSSNEPASGSISSAHSPATESKDPKFLENRNSVPCNLSMPPEERKAIVGARSLEVHVQNQTAESQAYPSADSKYLPSSINMVAGNGMRAPGGSIISSSLSNNWKPLSGIHSEHQVVTGMDSHMATPRDAVHDKSAEENIEDDSASVALLPPKYTMLDKWVMDHQKKRRLVEQARILKQHKAEQKIAACFDGLKRNVSSSEDLSAKTKSVIELKKLQLLGLQRRLRSDFLEDFFKPVAPEMEHLRSLKKHRHGRRVKQIEKYEQKMKEERLKRIRERQKEFFSDIELHKERLEEVFKVKRERLKGFNKYVKELHKRKERIHREKIDRIQREKITLLKINDVEGYLRMVQDAKSDRVRQLLKETEKYLQKLGSKLKDAKAAATRFEHDGDEMQKASDVENIDTMIENEDESDQAKHYKESNEKYYLMAHSVKESIAEQPAMLIGGKLREYQLNGLRWLVSLYNNHLNGILADEMGLGKTVQVISLMCYLMETKNDRGPFLVVVPSSVLPGWENEINFWAPSIQKIVYAGPPEERRRLFKEKIVHQKFNVLLTTYEYMMNKHDRPKLSKMHWHYIIIDEGHRIKNASCKLNAELKHYQSSHRLLLTGTPLQNNLEELWALLNFLLPNIFNSSEDFSQWFNKPFEGTGDNAAEEALLSEEENLLIINRLHQVLRPFVLRRLKHKVENQLPEKIERLIRCEASAYQKLLIKRVEDNLGSLGNPKARSVQNSVMEMRNICNHPYLSQLHSEEIDNLIPKHYLPPIIRLCGKLEMLDRLLPKLKATDHRVLFFSTMTRLLDVMEEYLNLKQYPYLRLDGHTSGGDRGALINRFNQANSPYFIFLLSIRAGGVGVNLQAADTVIIFDTDWNPQVDLQAQARAHRIGQKKDVLVLRFETVQTVEEQVRAAAEHKLGVANQSITAGFFDNNTSAEDRREYLESLLRESKKEEDAPVLDDDSLNDVIARKESEIEIFESIDQQRREEETVMWTNLLNEQVKDGTKLIPALPARLVTEKDLKAFCEAMKISETPQTTVPSTVGIKRKSGFVDTSQYGRGKRTREVRSYEEQMTEEEFEKMCQVENADSPGRDDDGVKTQLLTKATIGSSLEPMTTVGGSPEPTTTIASISELMTSVHPTLEPTMSVQPTLGTQASVVLPTPVTTVVKPITQVNQVTPPVKRGRGRPKRVVLNTSATQTQSVTTKIEPQGATPGVSVFPLPTARGSTEILTGQVSGLASASETKPSVVASPTVDSRSPVTTQERRRGRKPKGSSSMAYLTAGSPSMNAPVLSQEKAASMLSQEKSHGQNIPSQAESSLGITPVAIVDNAPNSQLSPVSVPASIPSQIKSVDPSVFSVGTPPVVAQEQPGVLAKEESSVVRQEQPPRRRGRKRKSEIDTVAAGMAGQDSKLHEQLQKQSPNLIGLQASSGSISAPSCDIVSAVNPCPENPDSAIRGKEDADANRVRVCGLPAPSSSQDPSSDGLDNISKGKQPAPAKIGNSVQYVASMMKEMLSAPKTKIGEHPEGEVRESPSLPVQGSASSAVTGGKNSQDTSLPINSAVETAHGTAGSPGIQSGGGDGASVGGNERRTRRATRQMAKKLTEEEEMPSLPPGFETLKKAEFPESGVPDATFPPPNNIGTGITLNQTDVTQHSGTWASNSTTSEAVKEPVELASCSLDESVNVKSDDSKSESGNTAGTSELGTDSENKPVDNLVTESKIESLESNVKNVEANEVKDEDRDVVVECHVEETASKQDLGDEPVKEKLTETCVFTITSQEGDTTKRCQQELDTKGTDIGEVLHSKDYSSELQDSPAELVLDELPVKTDLREDKGAYNSMSEVAELGDNKEDVRDQIFDSLASVSSPNNPESLPSSIAVEVKVGASNKGNADYCLAPQEAAQLEIPQQSDGLNLHLDSLAAVDGQVVISEVNPENADEAFEVKNHPLSSIDAEEIKESECVAHGDDSTEKTNPDTIRDEREEMDKKMAPTPDSAVSIEPKASVSLDEIKSETAQSDHSSVEDQRTAIPDLGTEQGTVLQGFDLDDSTKPETDEPDETIQDTQKDEKTDLVTGDAAVSGFDHVNLEISSIDEEPEQGARQDVHHTTLPRSDSACDQVKQEAFGSNAIEESEGNAASELVPKESQQSALPVVDLGSDHVEAQATRTDHTNEEPEEIATLEQVPEKAHDIEEPQVIVLQEVELGGESVQEMTCQGDDAMEELKVKAYPDQVAEESILTVSTDVESGCDLVKQDTTLTDHAISEDEGKMVGFQYMEEPQHTVLQRVGSGSDQVESKNPPADHDIEEPQENADLEQALKVVHRTELPVGDLGSNHVEQQISPTVHDVSQPQVNADLDEVPPPQISEESHHTELPVVDLGSDQADQQTDPTNHTALEETQAKDNPDEVPHDDPHATLSGFDSANEQVLADTCHPDDTLMEPLEKASPDQVPEKTHQDEADTESDHAKLEFAPTDSTVEVSQKAYSGTDQDKPETTSTNHVVEKPQGDSDSDQVLTIQLRHDSGSEEMQPDTSTTGHAIVEPPIENACQVQDPISESSEVSESIKESSASLYDSTDMEIDSVVLGGDAKDEVKPETDPADHALQEPQETASTFQVAEQAHNKIPSTVELESDTSKVHEPEVVQSDGAVPQQLDYDKIGAGQEDEVILTTTNSQIKPDSVSTIENVEQLVPEDSAVAGESKRDSLDEAKSESVTEAYESVEQQSAPIHDSTVAGESETKVSERVHEHSLQADDFIVTGETNIGAEVTEMVQEQSVPPNDFTVSEESKPLAEISTGETNIGAEVAEMVQEQSVPPNDFTVSEESKPLAEISEVIEQQSTPVGHSERVHEHSFQADDFIVTGETNLGAEVAELVQEQSVPLNEFTVSEESKPLAEISEVIEQQQSTPVDDSATGGEDEPKSDTKVSETLELPSPPADDSIMKEESPKPVDGVSETLEQLLVPADDFTFEEKYPKPVDEVSEILQQEPLQEADDSKNEEESLKPVGEVSETVEKQSITEDTSADAMESECVCEAHETLQQQCLPADNSAGAEEFKHIAEVSEILLQEPLPEADDFTVAEELKPVEEVSVNFQKETLSEASDCAGAEESKPIAEVSELLQQEPLTVADDSATTEESKPIAEASELLQQEPLTVADDSAGTEESKPIAEVSEHPQQEPLPAADDFADAEEPKPIAEISDILQQEPLQEADDSAVAEELKPEEEVSEILQKEPLQEADNSAGAEGAEDIQKISEETLPEAADDTDDDDELKAVGAVSESLEQGTLPKAAADSAGADELEPIEEVSESLEQGIIPEEANDAATAEELKPVEEVTETLQQEETLLEAADDAEEFMTPIETLEEQSVPEEADGSEELKPVVEVSETLDQGTLPEADESGAAAGESK